MTCDGEEPSAQPRNALRPKSEIEGGPLSSYPRNVEGTSMYFEAILPIGGRLVRSRYPEAGPDRDGRRAMGQLCRKCDRAISYKGLAPDHSAQLISRLLFFLLSSFHPGLYLPNFDPRRTGEIAFRCHGFAATNRKSDAGGFVSEAITLSHRRKQEFRGARSCSNPKNHPFNPPYPRLPFGQ